jgi:hypothetical protein
MSRARAIWLAGVVAIAIASLWTDSTALLERVLPALARSELATLDQLAGLRTDEGSPRSDAPLPVELDAAAPAAVRAAIAADEVYAPGPGPHHLFVELVVLERAAALRLSLERRGWTVHAPTPSRRRLFPGLAMVPMLIGLLAWARWRDRVIALVAAAGLAQLAVTLWPWPVALPAGSLRADLLAAPLVAPALALALRLDELGSMLAGGLIALCLVLAWFDHRRSRARGGRWLLRALLGAIAAVSLVEASTRASLPAWCTTWIGALASIGLVVLVVRCRAAWPTGSPGEAPA